MAELAPRTGDGMREQVGALVGNKNVAEVELRTVRDVTAPRAATLPRALRQKYRSPRDALMRVRS